MGSLPQQANPKPVKKQKVRPSLEPGVEGPAAEDGNSKFARALSSVDWHTREKGLQALIRFLAIREDLSDGDLLRLWKGLFYCFWHSDKVPVQEDLADRLASIMGQLKPEPAFRFFKAFVVTMRREWFGIDRLRLDKFLMLVRRFYCALFALLRDARWEQQLTTRYASLLRDLVLLPADTYAAVGYAYHVCDLFVPELKAAAAAGARDGKALPPAGCLRALLLPLCESLARAPDQPMVARVREAVFDALLQEVSSPGEDAPLRHIDETWLATHLFELGQQDGVKARNREALYQISQQLEKGARKRQKRSGGGGSGGGGSSEERRAPPAPASAVAAPAREGSAAGGRGDAFSFAFMPAANGASTPKLGRLLDADVEESGKKKKKKRKADEYLEGDAEPTPRPAGAAAAAAPSSSGKPGREAGPSSTGKLQQQQSARAPAAAAVVTTMSASGAKPSKTSGAAATNGTPHAAAASAADGSGKKTPPATSTTAVGKGDGGRSGGGAAAATTVAAPPPTTASKKSVKFNMKKNLYFDFGGPKPDPDLVSPPAARPRGSALKRPLGKSRTPAGKSSRPPGSEGKGSGGPGGQPGWHSAPPKSSGQHDGSTPGSASGRLQPMKQPNFGGSGGKHQQSQQQQQRRVVAMGSGGGGGSIPRPKASDFF